MQRLVPIAGLRFLSKWTSGAGSKIISLMSCKCNMDLLLLCTDTGKAQCAPLAKRRWEPVDFDRPLGSPLAGLLSEALVFALLIFFFRLFFRA